MRFNDKNSNTKTELIFSEELHPLASHIQFYKRIPSKEEAAQFIATLYNAAELSVECVIIALIYVDRFLDRTGISLQACNWARIFLGGK